eukprot:jgi/Botrbrau1/21896/Bobra.0249s0025.1
MRRTAAAVQSFSDDSSSDGSMGDTSAQERVMDLEQSLAAAERRAAEASCQIEALETSLAEAEKEGRQAQLRIEELESASVRAVAKADELQAAYKRLEKLELELTGAERKAALLAEELEVVREELARSAGSEETVEELGREVTELRAALVEERKQRNVAEEALAVAEEKLEDLRGLTEADQEELRSTVDDRDALKQQVAELNHKLKAMESHTQILAAGWEEKVERVRKQLQEREDEIAGMEPAHAIEPLRRECNDARAALIVAEAASAAAIAEIRDLKAQLQSAADKAQAAVRTLEAEIRAGKEREAQLVGELDDVRDSVACLNAQLWKDEKRERAGVGDLAHIHEDVEGLALRDWPAEMNANGGDNGPTQQLPRQAASLPAQLEAVQVELVTLKKRVARQTEELAGRDARLADLESELKGAAAQLQELKESTSVEVEDGDNTSQAVSTSCGNAVGLGLKDMQAKTQDSEDYIAVLTEEQQMVGRTMATQHDHVDDSQTLPPEELPALTTKKPMLKSQVSQSTSRPKRSMEAMKNDNLSQRWQTSKSQAIPPEQYQRSFSSQKRTSFSRSPTAHAPLVETVQAQQASLESLPPRPDLESTNMCLQQECDRLKAGWETATAEVKGLEHEVAAIKELYTSLDVENASLRRKILTLEEHMESNAVLTRDNSKNHETTMSLLETKKAATEAEHQKALCEVEALQLVYTNLSEKYEQLMMQFEHTKLKLEKSIEESRTQVKLLTIRLKAAEDLVVQRDNLQAVFVKQVCLLPLSDPDLGASQQSH